MIDLWQEIYGTIKRNKLRTFLTGFAVAWGIFMLIVLLGAGNGLIHAFEQNTMQSALNSIRVYPGVTTEPYDGLQEGRYIELDNRDVEDTREQFTEHVSSTGATLQQSGVNISYKGEYVSLSLLGVYPNYREVEAVKTFDLATLAIFGTGAVIGITSFSRLLSYALKHFRNITLAVLTGFMLGSLNKVWPWKEIMDNAHGMPIETNILPNAHVPEAVALMIVGFLLVYVLEKLSAKK